MRRTLGALLLVALVSGCGSDAGDRADDDAGTSTPPATPPATGPLPDLTVATTDEQPCGDAEKVELDDAVASGGVWMPNTDLARAEELVDAWLCEADLPALQWQDVTVLFLPDAPKGSPGAFFRDAMDRLGRGRMDTALGGPALVLDPESDSPAEVDVIMGDTHIVLIGAGDTTGDELLAVADSMAPLH